RLILCSVLLLSLMLCITSLLLSIFFFFNDTAPTVIYTLSLHDALPISLARFFYFERSPKDLEPAAISCFASASRPSGRKLLLGMTAFLGMSRIAGLGRNGAP